MSLDSTRAAALASGGRRSRSTAASEAPTPTSAATTSAKSTTGSTRSTRPTTNPTAVRTRPFRLTVDLPPAVHADLSRWIIDAELRAGVNVDKRAVMLALLQQLFDDRELAATVEQTVTTRD